MPIEPSLTRHRHTAAQLFVLMVAAEAIFFLPFVIARIFRPTLLDVFQITNLQLGLAFSAYGVVAMLAYFPGGPLADLWAPRKLMATALLSTAAGGLVLAMIPEQHTLRLLYAYWGLTSILLFWAALIRAVRQLGGDKFAGSAFGILDGGRGLVAAAAATTGVLLYEALLPTDVEAATLEQRTAAFRTIILAFTSCTVVAALLVMRMVDPTPSHVPSTRLPFRLTEMWRILKLPAVWGQAIIIVCAYVTYKGLDDVSLYAEVALGFNDVNAAHAGTISMWVRPLAAIGAGYIADRTRVSWLTAVSFLALAGGSGIIASGILEATSAWVFFVVIASTSVAVHALRGLYFAIMQEGAIPLRYTGTAVGVVSTIGFTPDIFMGPLMGKLLDDSPGVLGHQHVFAVIAGFSLMGLLSAVLFPRLIKRQPVQATHDD